MYVIVLANWTVLVSSSNNNNNNNCNNDWQRDGWLPLLGDRLKVSERQRKTQNSISKRIYAFRREYFTRYRSIVMPLCCLKQTKPTALNHTLPASDFKWFRFYCCRFQLPDTLLDFMANDVRADIRLLLVLFLSISLFLFQWMAPFFVSLTRTFAHSFILTSFRRDANIFKLNSHHEIRIQSTRMNFECV